MAKLFSDVGIEMKRKREKRARIAEAFRELRKVPEGTDKLITAYRLGLNTLHTNDYRRQLARRKLHELANPQFDPEIPTSAISIVTRDDIQNRSRTISEIPKSNPDDA